ncbi:MAG: DUF4153 domain-containing protein [Clostridiaceae bacterium]
MKLSYSILNLIKSLYKSIRRFPISIALSTAFVILTIVISEIRPYNNQNLIENLEKISMILALGFVLSLCITMYFEKKKLDTISQKIIATISSSTFLILYYFFLLKNFNMISITRYIGISLILYISFVFIPYLEKKDNFELYVIKIFGRFFITAIYSAVLYGGTSAILATIDLLLEINIPSDFYFYAFLIVAGIFAPTYYLGGLPSITDTFTKKNYPNIFKVLLLYIVMPLISIYTIILYIYFIKIIITVKWPVGLVSHLVLWYSVITAAVLFFITPIYKDNKFANKFMNILPKSIIPLIILMFISIGIRIKAYGITENRYYVIALSIWVFGAMIYFALRKNHRNVILPISFSIIILISVFGGPINSYSVSLRSQSTRLKNILIGNNMLSNNTIIKNETLSDNDKAEISSIIEYINNDHELSDIDYLPKDFKIETMNKVFGFSLYYNDYYRQNNFYFNLTQNGSPLDINGYDYLFDSNNSYENGSNSQLKINYDHSSNEFKFINGSETLYSKDLKELVEKLVDKYGISEKGTNIDLKDMTFEDENSEVKIKFLITNIYGSKNSTDNGIALDGINFYVVIKMK